MSDLLNYILSHEDAFRKNRLPSLYSDFVVQKKTNPDGYAVNVAAWEKALTNAAWAGYVNSGTATGNKRDHLVLTADENLLHSLQLSGWGKPVALASVFDEAIQTQTMIPWEVYTSPNFSLAVGRWKAYQPGVMTPWHVMNWGLRQLKGLVVGTDNASAQLQSQKLVLINNLKETAKLALHLQNSRYTSALDHIYSKERFKLTFSKILDNNTELSDTDIDALLTYLSRDSKAISYDGKTIKFLTDNDKSAVTSQDATIASIKDLIANLTREVSRLEQKIDELNDNAKAALAKKNRISALSAVKKRKIAEHNLTQRINTLHQLEEVDSKIEQSVGQIEIVRVMQASTGVLRSLNAKMGDVETVEEVVKNLREEMCKVDEIGTIMNETGPVIDEGEIDEELAALETTQVREREDKEAQATKHKLQLLEDHERAAREETRGKIISKEAANDVESDLAASIGQLSNMSLKDTSTVTAKLDEQEATELTSAQ